MDKYLDGQGLLYFAKKIKKWFVSKSGDTMSGSLYVSKNIRDTVAFSLERTDANRKLNFQIATNGITAGIYDTTATNPDGGKGNWVISTNGDGDLKFPILVTTTTGGSKVGIGNESTPIYIDANGSVKACKSMPTTDNFVSKSGDTMSGNLTTSGNFYVSKSESVASAVSVERTDTGRKINFQIASDGRTAGIYDTTPGNTGWLINSYKSDATGKTDLKIPKWANIGDSSTPIYFDETGVPKECSSISGSGGSSVTVDSVLSSTSTNPVQNKVINTALSGKVPTSRTVNGYALSSNISLDASDVGALSDAGGTATDNIYVSKSSGTIAFAIKRSSGTRQINFEIASDGVSAGLYDAVAKEWILKTTGTGNLSFPVLGSVGSTSKPIYIDSNGQFKECTSVSGGSSITVDSALSSTSTNPVQNNVINTALAGKVPTTRTVNGKALSSNITLSASDVSAVSSSRTVNGKPLTSNVTLTASDVGALGSTATAEAAKKLNGQLNGTVSSTKKTLTLTLPANNYTSVLLTLCGSTNNNGNGLYFICANGASYDASVNVLKAAGSSITVTAAKNVVTIQSTSTSTIAVSVIPLNSAYADNITLA